MSNKYKDWPDWANYKTTDYDGTTRFWRYKPTPNDMARSWTRKDYWQDDDKLMTVTYKNWENLIEKRDE